MLDSLEGEPLDVFVVWIPAIPSDRYEETARARKLISDDRARHYWDGSQAFGEAVSPLLGLRAKMAWDVYAIYGADAGWSTEPMHWMHQLRQEDPARMLDEKALTEQLREAIATGR